jgi:hypothetical protein
LDGGMTECKKFYEKLVGDICKETTKRHNGFSTFFLFFFGAGGDEAFTLCEHFLKPFSQKDLNPERKIFNYHLSRVRRRVGNVFGIMASSFRIFWAQINFKLDCIDTTVMTCCVLHNYLHLRCTSFREEVSNMEELQRDKNVFIPL